MTSYSLRRFRPAFLGIASLAVFAVSLRGEEKAAAPAEHPNRLITEKSPYLRQHAFNPVDWYPWGEEAFARARKENKPIFLSIGYATCHWCHVMERESFSDPATAKVMNDHFVCIKVDREERPDVDRIYMLFLQASTGSGGWPMSIWLTPDLKPFFGGVYFPPVERDGQPAFRTVLGRIAESWRTSPGTIVEQAGQIMQALHEQTATPGVQSPKALAKLRSHGVAVIAGSFDAKEGGFDSTPKFPQPATIEFLLDVQAVEVDSADGKRARTMALRTLRALDDGGIHDQLGGGFHRYAVDARWRVPHFEKMLCDQAQLVNCYVAAWQVSQDPAFRSAAEDTLDYVQRRLTSADGAFFAAEDADSARATGNSERHEGAFYTWTLDELRPVVGETDAALVEYRYGLEAGGNTGATADPELKGRNTLYRAHTLAECAAHTRRTEADVSAALERARRALADARERRPKPFRDENILTAWNGLTISAFARAGNAFGRPEYVRVAERAAAFLQDKLVDPVSGELVRSFHGGQRDAAGFAEDYALLVQGLLDLYEAGFDVRWLRWAVALQKRQDALFWDEAGGGYFTARGGEANLVLRLKQDNDDAEPAASSVAARNLARLAEILQREDLRDRAHRTVAAFGSTLERNPAAMPQLLIAAGWLEATPQQVLIVGAPDSAEADKLLAVVRGHAAVHRVVVRVDPPTRMFLEPLVPFVASLPPEENGRAMAYVCENFMCQLPTHDLNTLARLLDQRRATK